MSLIATELHIIIHLLMEGGCFENAQIWDGDKEIPVSEVSLGYIDGNLREPYFTISTDNDWDAWQAPTHKTTVVVELVATDIPRITFVCEGHPARVIDLRGVNAKGIVDVIRKNID